MNFPGQLGHHRVPAWDQPEFRSIVGALHFCAHSVRPEIAAPVTQLSRYLADPSVYHLKQARKILSYLRRFCDTKCVISLIRSRGAMYHFRLWSIVCSGRNATHKAALWYNLRVELHGVCSIARAGSSNTLSSPSTSLRRLNKHGSHSN